MAPKGTNKKRPRAGPGGPQPNAKKVAAATKIVQELVNASTAATKEDNRAHVDVAVMNMDNSPEVDRAFIQTVIKDLDIDANRQRQLLYETRHLDEQAKASAHQRGLETEHQKAHYKQFSEQQAAEVEAVKRNLAAMEKRLNEEKTAHATSKQESRTEIIKQQAEHATLLSAEERAHKATRAKHDVVSQSEQRTQWDVQRLTERLESLQAGIAEERTKQIAIDKQRGVEEKAEKTARATEETKKIAESKAASDKRANDLRVELTRGHEHKVKDMEDEESRNKQKRDIEAINAKATNEAMAKGKVQRKKGKVETKKQEAETKKQEAIRKRIADDRDKAALEAEKKAADEKNAEGREQNKQLEEQVRAAQQQYAQLKEANRKKHSGTPAERREAEGQSDISKVGQALKTGARVVGGGLLAGAKSAAMSGIQAIVGGGKKKTMLGKDGKGRAPSGPGPGFVPGPEPIDFFESRDGPDRHKKSKKPKRKKPTSDDERKGRELKDGENAWEEDDRVVEVDNGPGAPPTVAGVISDGQSFIEGIQQASPILAGGLGYIGTALAVGGAHRAYNWINPDKNPGPNLRPPPGVGPMPKMKKQKTGPVIDADMEESGGGEGEGRGTNKGRKKQNKQTPKFQSQGGYLTKQAWDMPKTQLLQNGSDPDPGPDPEPAIPDPHGPQDPMTPGQVWPPVVLPGNVDRASDTLRPRYGMVGPRDVIPSPMDQLRSDIAFDMFSFVQPGYGNGYDNKLFQYQENTMNNVQAVGRSFLPRPDDGRLNYQHPMPFQWQSVQDVNRSARLLQREEDLIPLVNALVRKLGEGSSGVLGRDVPEVPVSVSSQGLHRDIRSPFEPVIQTADNMHPTLDPAGYLLSQRGWRRDFSPWREPQVREIQPLMNRGPHLNKRRSLEVILP